ncbi:VOC family protein [Halolamina salina]
MTAAGTNHAPLGRVGPVMPADHLGHVHLKVTDVDRAVAFYRDVLGLEVTERVDRYAFLSLGEHHHDLALQGIGAEEVDDGVPAAPRGPRVGLYHSAWEVDSADELRATAERLAEREVAVSPVDNGVSKALYFDDPDGNGVEVYLDTREERDIEQWNGRNERFDPFSL